MVHRKKLAKSPKRTNVHTPAKSAQPTAREWNLEPLLTIEDVTRLLQITRPTLYTLFEQGLPRICFGRTIRIAPSSLQQFLVERERSA